MDWQQVRYLSKVASWLAGTDRQTCFIASAFLSSHIYFHPMFSSSSSSSSERKENKIYKYNKLHDGH
jgi:uncharacterized membrane protein YhhN